MHGVTLLFGKEAFGLESARCFLHKKGLVTINESFLFYLILAII